MFFNENKRIRLRNNRGLGRDTNMAAISLFKGTTMAAVTSCENREYMQVLRSKVVTS